MGHVKIERPKDAKLLPHTDGRGLRHLFKRCSWEAEASQHRLKEARANQEFVTAELQRAKEAYFSGFSGLNDLKCTYFGGV